MATQTAKIIDVTRTFVPVDPNAFPENYSATNREDYPEAKKPVMCYAGHNFLPTPYGYKSFFGVNSVFDADSLESRADELFIVQTNTFENILVALTEDGIWTKQGDSSGAWTQVVTLEVPDEGSHLDWTYCLIGNTLFCYRATEPQYYSFSTLSVFFTPGQVASGVTGLAVTENAGVGTLPAGNYYYRVAFFQADGQLSLPTSAEVEVTNLNSSNTVTWNTLPAAVGGYRLYVTNSLGETKYVDVAQSGTPSFDHTALTDIPNAVTLPDQSPIVQYEPYEFYAVTPTFLNMAGQQGLFKAGSRLGFWDTENSVSWSSIDDFADFEPSVTTLAGGAVFNEVIGRITMILSSADGFVIYATKSIVHIGRNLQSTFNWNPTVIAKGTGIPFKRQCCSASPDTTQFAYTTTGLMQIDGNKGEYIVPEVTDYLKESKQPVFLKILEGRFLFLEILDANYVSGLVEFEEVYVPGSEYNFDYVIDYLDAELPAHQDAIEQARIDLDLPEKQSGTEYKSVIQGQTSVIRQVPDTTDPDYTPTAVSSRLINDADLGLPPGYFFTYSGGLSSVATLGNDGNSLFTADSNNNVGNVLSEEVKWIFSLDDPVDESSVVEIEHVDPFFAQQRETWEALDADVLSFIAAVSLYSSVKKPYKNGEVYVTSSYAPESPVVDSRSVVGIGLEFSNPGTQIAAFFIGEGTPDLIEQLGSLQTQFTTPAVRWENGVLYLRRQLLTVTGLVSRVSFSINQIGSEDTFVPEGGGKPDRTHTHYFYESIATVTTEAVSGDATELFPDPIYQEASAALTGYRYTDINGDIQFIPIEAVDWEIPPDIPTEQEYPDIPPLSLPPTSFLLQTGSIGPIYPTIPGAYVYDMQLKKWGKMKQDYKLLLDFAPINNTAGQVITNDVFGITGGIMQTNGKIALFDKFPEDSELKYGKIGYFRQGFTSLQEVRATFRDFSEGYIKVETSIDGVNVDSSLTTFADFSVARDAQAFPNISGRWHTVTIGGVWDLKHLEYRGFDFGKR